MHIILAIGGLATAFVALDDLPTQEDRGRLNLALRKHLDLDAAGAEELEVMGQWFVNECKGPESAVPRLAKRLKRLDDGASFATLMNLVQAAAKTPLSQKQSEALNDIRQAFRIQ